MGKNFATLEVHVKPPIDILLSLRKKVEDNSFFHEAAHGIRIVQVWANPNAHPGGALYERFRIAYKAAADKTCILAFHGTGAENVRNISQNGLDPARRRGQASGCGEYFGKNFATSLPYCRGSSKILVFALLLDGTGLTFNSDSIVVIHRVDHQLPLLEVTFQ